MLPPRLAELAEGIGENRRTTLRLVADLSEEEFAFRPAGGWSAADVLEHLTIAETGTSKVIRKVLKEGQGTLPPYPSDDSVLAVRPRPARPDALREAPDAARPRGGRGKEELLALAAESRAQTLASLAMLAAADPRSAEFPHALLGPLNLYEWPVLIILMHERQHHAQLGEIRSALGK